MSISPGGWKDCGLDTKPAPSRPLSQKTLMEMWAGRKLTENTRLQQSLPPEDYRKYVQWTAWWTEQIGKALKRDRM